MKQLSIFITTLGCSKNEVDSQVIVHKLQQEGFAFTNDVAVAQIIIINTCAFINVAKEEALDTILQAITYKQNGECRWLVVCGCLAQRYGKSLEKLLPEVDLFLGVNAIANINERITALINKNLPKEFQITKPTFLMNAKHQRVLPKPRHYAYLKIADGCDNKCSYCAIPQIRGKYRSRPINDIMEEARFLSSLGVKELIISAQDTTAYGKDLTAEQNIATLLSNLSKLHDIHWIRLLYGHPARI
ncbi:MAG: radical SAM protein, partial [Deltaproteobacteria bacterium]